MGAADVKDLGRGAAVVRRLLVELHVIGVAIGGHVAVAEPVVDRLGVGGPRGLDVGLRVVGQGEVRPGPERLGVDEDVHLRAGLALVGDPGAVGRPRRPVLGDRGRIGDVDRGRVRIGEVEGVDVAVRGAVRVAAGVGDVRAIRGPGGVAMLAGGRVERHRTGRERWAAEAAAGQAEKELSVGVVGSDPPADEQDPPVRPREHRARGLGQRHHRHEADRGHRQSQPASGRGSLGCVHVPP